jgi:hypothetical protein
MVCHLYTLVCKIVAAFQLFFEVSILEIYLSFKIFEFEIRCVTKKIWYIEAVSLSGVLMVNFYVSSLYWRQQVAPNPLLHFILLPSYLIQYSLPIPDLDIPDFSL